MSRDVQQSFAHSGAMHILAVSGLHVGILFAIILFLVKPLTRGRLKPLALAIVLLLLWAFALITRLSPSVRRSAFMFSLIAITLVISRKTNIYNSLAASAFFMLLFFPSDLFSVGFWLSYLAVIAIVSLYPLINNLLFFPKPFDKIWSLLSVSIAAQIGTLPIGLYVFHQFPNYFLLTNLLAIPLAGIILYLAMALFVFSAFGPVAHILAKLLSFSVKALWIGIRTIEHLPGAFSSDIYITFVQMIILYVLFISFILFFVLKDRVFIFSFLGMLILFQAVNLIEKVRLTFPPRVIVYNIPKSTGINFIGPGFNILLADSLLVNNPLQIRRTIKPYWRSAHIKDATVLTLDTNLNFSSKELFIKNNLVLFLNRKFLLLNQRNLLEKSTKNKFDIDFLLLCNNIYLKIGELNKFFNFKKIILCSSNKVFRNKTLQGQCDTLGINCHNVTEQGAWVLKIKEK